MTKATTVFEDRARCREKDGKPCLGYDQSEEGEGCSICSDVARVIKRWMKTAVCGPKLHRSCLYEWCQTHSRDTCADVHRRRESG